MMSIDIDRLRAVITSGQTVLLGGRQIGRIDELERAVEDFQAHLSAGSLPLDADPAPDIERLAEERAEELYQTRIALLLAAAPPMELGGLMAKTVAQLRDDCRAVGIEPGERSKADLVELLAGAAISASLTAWVVRRDEDGTASYWAHSLEFVADVQEAVLLHDRESAMAVARDFEDAEAVEIPWPAR
jgi:hypothetical protein